MSSLPFAVKLILTVSLGCASAWILAEMMRRLAVRGSAARYRFATVEHAMRYPALIYLVLSLILAINTGDLGQAVIDAAATGLWGYVTWEKARGGDDDDDWFSDQRKKLKRWAASLGRTPATGAAGA